MLTIYKNLWDNISSSKKCYCHRPVWFSVYWYRMRSETNNNTWLAFLNHREGILCIRHVNMQQFSLHPELFFTCLLTRVEVWAAVQYLDELLFIPSIFRSTLSQTPRNTDTLTFHIMVAEADTGGCKTSLCQSVVQCAALTDITHPPLFALLLLHRKGLLKSFKYCSEYLWILEMKMLKNTFREYAK